MILLPIGHEQESTRRLPGVTFGIMILCGLAFVATGFGGSRTESENLQAVQRAAEYWMQHPYLKLDPTLEKSVSGPVMRRDARDAFQEGMRTFAEKPEDAEMVRAEQAQLDTLRLAAQNATPDHPSYRWGLVPSWMSIVTLITHMFLHAGWLHILGNLFILYLAGPFIEDVWGRPVFAAFYGVSGIVAALTFALPHRGLTEPLVGASGAIAGVMGAFAVRYWATRLQFFYAVGLSLRGTFWAPAWLMLGVWFVQQLTLAGLTSGGSSETGGHVAYLSHIGGFTFGAAVAVAFRQWKVEERHLAPSIEARTNKVLVEHAEVRKALEIADAGNAEEAWTPLEAEARRQPENVDAVLALWSVAIQIEKARETALGGKGHAKEATDALRRALPAAGSSPSPALALKIARAAVELDPAVARAALKVALARPELDAEGRKAAEGLQARLAATSAAR